MRSYPPSDDPDRSVRLVATGVPAGDAEAGKKGVQSRTAAAVAAKARIRDAAQTRILQAAAEVFAGKGYGGATMAEIAEHAAMPTATVHYYFGNKGALYEAVLAQVLSLWTNELQHLDAGATPAAALASYVEAKMRVSFAYPAASRIVASEVLQGGERLKPFLIDTFAPLLRQKLAQIEHWQDSGHLRRLDPLHLLFAIWAVTEFYANFSAEIMILEGEDVLAPSQRPVVTAGVVDLLLNGALPRVRTAKRARSPRSEREAARH